MKLPNILAAGVTAFFLTFSTTPTLAADSTKAVEAHAHDDNSKDHKDHEHDHKEGEATHHDEAGHTHKEGEEKHDHKDGNHK